MKYDDTIRVFSPDRGESDTPVSLNEKVYSDEPIKKRNMGRIEVMRSLKPALNGEANSAYVFYVQALTMADYEEDYDYMRYCSNCKVYEGYQSYSPLTSEQLRAYFSWRKDLRNGKYPPVIIAFLRIYLNEIINLIGVNDSMHGYRILRDIEKHYYSGKISGGYFLHTVMTDYVIYYGLDCSLIPVSRLKEPIANLKKLINCREAEDSELVEAISYFSDYKLDESKFYQENKENVCKFTAYAIRRVSDIVKEKHNSTLADKLFGTLTVYPYFPFYGNLHFVKDKMKTCSYSNGGAEIYCCNEGKWTKSVYENVYQSKRVRSFIRTIERVFREKTGYRHKLKEDAMPVYIVREIENAAYDYLREKNKPKIQIDISKLEGIRSASEITREKLIVEEENEEIIETVSESEESVKENSEILLSDGESAFLHAMLYEESTAEIPVKYNSMASVLADGINEKLFDYFSDNVIEFDGDTPVLIEDYTDELKGMIKK